MKYIAKEDTWYKAGTEVVLEEHMYDDWYLCCGIRVNIGEHPSYQIGEEYDDGEICSIDEFEAIDDNT